MICLNCWRWDDGIDEAVCGGGGCGRGERKYGSLGTFLSMENKYVGDGCWGFSSSRGRVEGAGHRRRCVGILDRVILSFGKCVGVDDKYNGKKTPPEGLFGC